MSHMENNSPSTDFELAKLQGVMLDRWPILLGMGIVGALIGFGVSLLRPPVYQAENTIGVVINYSLTQPLDLVVEDRVFDRAMAIVLEDAVMNEVLEDLPGDVKVARGWEGPQDLRKSVRLDRKLSEWDLAVLDRDPVVAATVSDLWTDASLTVLHEALDHAWRAAQLVLEASDVEEFSPDQIQVAWWGEPIWECQVVPIDIDENILSEQIQAELRQSRGLFPSLVVDHLQQAEPPKRPLRWHRGSFVLGGALLGFIAGGLGLILRTRPFRDGG